MEQSYMSTGNELSSVSTDGSETSLVQSSVSTVTGSSPPTEDEDTYPDEIVPIISCCILLLFILMIILLLLISNVYVTDYDDGADTEVVTYKPGAPTKGYLEAHQRPLSIILVAAIRPVILEGTLQVARDTSQKADTLQALAMVLVLSQVVEPHQVVGTLQALAPETSQRPLVGVHALQARHDPQYDHEYDKYDYKHDQQHDPQYDHEYDKYDYQHDPQHDPQYDHKYDKYDNKYDNKYDHKYDHEHEHNHDHEHDHEHDHNYDRRSFTLICVFEYLDNIIPRNTPQCTDYVYIRFFVYSYRVNQEPLIFEHKKRMDGAAKLYYDDTPAVWRKLGSYRALDNYVKNSKRYFPLSRWFLGIWGSTFSRLMASLWDGDIFRKALRTTLRSNFSDKLTMKDFNGFAIINTIIQDTRILGRAKSFGETFRAASEPILEPDWVYIHTAAIWPGGNVRVPDSMVFDVLRDADVVGISTSNTTDENNIILGRAGGNVSPYKAASPPNPLNAVAPGTRGMLDILREFPHWKQVLKRQSLCFSVTTSINYMRSSVDPIDFVSEVHNDQDVQRFGRLRFTTKGSNNKYPVQDMQTYLLFRQHNVLALLALHSQRRLVNPLRIRQRSNAVVQAERDAQGLRKRQETSVTSLWRWTWGESASVDRLFDVIREHSGGTPVSIIVNNAAIGTSFASIADSTEDDFDRVIKTNLKGTFLMSRAGIRRMLDAAVKEGAVVNVSSITAKSGMKGLASYVASKTGVLGLTKSMALDVAGTGIRCNAVLPGFTVTPMSDHLTEDEKKQLTATIPLSRPAQPREVAQVVAFLCSPQSSYMVGTMVDVSGGAVL
ncbi:hypothetical protein MTO96_029242 [Rhipicephalus appendiculatus]